MRAYRMYAGAIAIIILSVACLGQQPTTLPADGRIVFESEGCLSCHAVNGVGGTVGPDLGRQSYVSNDYDLASKMWNHSPKMMLMMARARTDRPVLTGRDFRSLAQFLSYVRFLGRPGDAAAGERLFTEKKCAECHSLGHSVAGKSPLDSLTVFMAPVRLAQSMWNHNGDMQAASAKRMVPLPQFRDDEFADLSAYIRAASALRSWTEIRSFVGDPVMGDSLFHDKGCFDCHVTQTTAPRLDTIGSAKSLTEIAGVMWNHAGAMSMALESAKQTFPRLNGDEMANVISFLYTRSIPVTHGSTDRGEALFTDKGCADCHVQGNTIQAPSVEKIGPFPQEQDFLAALWNHAVRMEQLHVSKGKWLPQLKPEDVRSIGLYIDSKSPPSH